MTELHKAKQLIDSVDLSQVIERLVLIDKWKRKDAIAACAQYRNYLYLKKKYGHEYELPPSWDIDEAWHAHILHTEDYVNFCDQAFGHYLHHHPHSKQGTLSTKQLTELFETQTQKLYKKEFGEYLYAVQRMPLHKKAKAIIKKLVTIRSQYQAFKRQELES